MRSFVLVPFALLLAAGCRSDTSPEAVCRQIEVSARLEGHVGAELPGCVADMEAYQARMPAAYERYARCVIGSLQTDEISRCGRSDRATAEGLSRRIAHAAATYADMRDRVPELPRESGASEGGAEAQGDPSAPPRAARRGPGGPRRPAHPLLALLGEHPDVDLEATAGQLTVIEERVVAQTNLAHLYMAAQAHADEHGGFPAAAVAASATSCCDPSAPCAEAERWARVPWAPSELAAADTPHFTYAYRPSEDGASFTVSAHGDLDCDGERSLLRVRGSSADLSTDLRAFAALSPIEDRAPLE